MKKPKKTQFEIRTDHVVPASGEVWVLHIQDIMNLIGAVRAVMKAQTGQINWDCAHDVEALSRYCLGILDAMKAKEHDESA